MDNSDRPFSVLVAHPSADLYGSDRVLLESVEGLLNAGARVLATVPEQGPLVAALTARGARVTFCATPVLRKSLLSARGMVALADATFRGAFQGVALIRRSRPHVILANTVTVPLWTVLGRALGIPVITHVHEAEGNASGPLRALLALPLLASTQILTNSRYSSTVLEASLPWLQGRSVVVYNGVAGPKSVTPPRMNVADTLRVLYVGRLSHRKGVDVAVEAVRILRQQGYKAVLDVVGAVFRGNETYEAGLRAKAEAIDGEPLAVFHGFQNDIWPFLARADVAVVPSRIDEPFGNTAVEALLAARPAVVSNTSGLREAAGGYAAVKFVTPGDPEDLARALSAIAGSWEEYRQRALSDAGTAALRHNPEGYGANIAAHVKAVVRR